MPISRNRFAQSLSLAFCILLLSVGFLVYGATGHDDAHITFWSAHALSTFGDIVNYNHDHTQQSSALLLTILLAGIHSLTGSDIPAIGYMIGIAASLACCILISASARDADLSERFLALTLTLSSTSFMLWTYSGMESNLTALCVLACAISWGKWIDQKSPSLSLLVIVLMCSVALLTTRPEMPLVAFAVTAFLCFINWKHQSERLRYLQLCGLIFFLSGALLVWQKIHFDSWFPLPVIAKQGADLAEKTRGGIYYLFFYSAINPVVLFALIAAPLLCWNQHEEANPDNSTDTLSIVSATFVLVYSGFICTAGGDWMQAGRFLVPIIPLASLLLVSRLRLANKRRITTAFLILLCVFQFGMQYNAISRESKGIPAWVKYHIAAQHKHYSIFEQLNQEHLRDMAAIDHIAEIIPPLHEQLRRPVILMSGQAGMVFYYTAIQFGQDVVFRDLRGLVESNLTHCPTIKNVPRSQQGIFWSYQDFFALLPQLQMDCGVVKPDIIYDLNDMSRKRGQELEQFGYTLLHQETGFPVENSTRLPYNRLYAPNLIFVRNELLPLLGNPPKRVVDYRNLPLATRWPMPSNSPAHE